MVAQLPPTNPTLHWAQPPSCCLCSPGLRTVRCEDHEADPGSLSTFSTVLAHQGGWDEILFVLVPIALFAFLLRVANRRASRLEANDDATAPDDT